MVGVPTSFEAPHGAAPQDDGIVRHAAVRGDRRATKHPDLAIIRVSLTNFRSYAACEFATGGRPIVLSGANGAGKTNILDALSMLAPGKGLRSSTLAEHARKGPAPDVGTLWAVAATVARGGEAYEIGTGLSAGAGGATRQVRLNGAPAESSAELGEIVRMAWLTPAMDRLFIESASGRRRFLDRLTLGFVPSHGKAALRYDQATRERARLLKYGPREPSWLDGLEAQMAEHGVMLTLARATAIERLNASLQARREIGAFPAAELAMRGEADDTVRERGEESVAIFRDRLASSRIRDAESGRTNFGPHVSDLAVRHTDKRADARDCSTGEQKALLISIVLAQAAELSHIGDGFTPILLLDEIVAHLDAKRRAALFDEILALGAQAWMTGTDAQMFESLKSRADHFDVAASRLSLISE